MSNVKRLAVAIVRFLGDQLHSQDLSADAKESLEVAIQCLETAYGVGGSQASSLQVSRPLLDIFEEGTKHETVNTPSFTPKAPPSDEAKAEAEKLKNEGNNLMKLDRFQEALDCYTKAIELDGCNAIYFCNRAAAFSKLNDHQSAIEDCKNAILIDPTYSKAYGRMGLAYASLNEHQRARDCYQKAVTLDPLNESYINNLKVAEEKLRELNLGPDGGAGGVDLSSVFGNPALINMATQLIQDSNMRNMMAGLMSNTMTTGGGGMDALLQAGQQLAAQMQAANPDLVEQLRQQLNTGGEPNSGSGGVDGTQPDPANP